jgi:protein-L-isoaspartate(D-aspartate) O-methyltransferase
VIVRSEAGGKADRTQVMAGKRDVAADRRERMVQTQIADRGIRSPDVLRAMRSVPRERFVAPDMAAFAYDDSPLPIDQHQTISQPYIVAAMIEAACVGPRDTVLEVGAGSGYAAAVLGQIAARVIAVERHAALATSARERIAALGYGNVEIRTGDGTRGCADASPFDAILVSAAAPEIPAALENQLAMGGRLVIPVGDESGQRLIKVTRTDADTFEQEDLASVMFVPLIGEHGWR